jgi:ABC-2 type transport system permease protein
MANKILLVAQREYLENVRTKTFWISIFIVPILIALMIGGGALLNRLKEVQSYTVVDLGDGSLRDRAEREFRQNDLMQLFARARSVGPDGRAELRDLAQRLGPLGPDEKPTAEQMLVLYEWMQRQDPAVLARAADLETSSKFHYRPLDELGITATSAEQRIQELNRRIQRGDLFAYFVLGEEPTKSLTGFDYVSNNLTDGSLRQAYENTLTRIVQQQRIEDAGISPAVARHIQERVSFGKKQVDATGSTAEVKRENEADKWAPIGFVYFLWIAIFSIANLLLTNTIEEKSNRIIEVLLSSVSPHQLMQGKIWGIAGTGLTIVGTWVGFGLLAAWIAPAFLGESGGLVQMLLVALGNSGYLVAFVLYFLGGFLLYAAVLVAIGSVCNTLKEAQNLMQPVVMVLMVPLIAMVFITQEPNGLVARVLSFVPLFTPFTMMNRAGGPPELWEYVVTTLLLLLTIWFVMRAAGKVFRVGVLMTGNPPKLKEILGWLRQS